jgi:hypothetical protein
MAHSESSFSRATLTQRLAALFAGGLPNLQPIQLPTHSDLRLVEGDIAGRRVLVVATDPAAQLGTLGISECDDFQWALQRARATGVPLVLLIDSAGARLNAGLPIQGALRRLMRSLLDARSAGLPVLALLGRYAFGAASVLVGTAEQRLHTSSTLLSMSGPKVLLAQAPALDAELVAERINGAARSALSPADVLLKDTLKDFALATLAWVAEVTPRPLTLQQLAQDRIRLTARLPVQQFTPALRDDIVLCKLQHGFGAADALRLCAQLEHAAAHAPGRALTLAIDCAGHSVLLDDEEIFLTQYLVHLAATLRQLTRSGVDIRLQIHGQISGGIYIALAAAATSTELADGACVRTLPAATLQHILGDLQCEVADPHAHLAWGVVDKLLSPEQVEKLTPA